MCSCKNAADAGVAKYLQRRIDAIGASNEPNVHDDERWKLRSCELGRRLRRIRNAGDFVSSFPQYVFDFACCEEVILHNEDLCRLAHVSSHRVVMREVSRREASVAGCGKDERGCRACATGIRQHCWKAVQARKTHCILPRSRNSTLHRAPCARSTFNLPPSWRASPLTRPSPEDRLGASARSNPGPSSSTHNSNESWPSEFRAFVRRTWMEASPLPFMPCLAALVRSSLRIRASGMAVSLDNFSAMHCEIAMPILGLNAWRALAHTPSRKSLAL